MTRELQLIENLFFQCFNQKITDYSQDLECEEYCGCNFKINQLNIKFRKAKVTPKKTGLFVTLWKRNIKGETVPFCENDAFDIYIIAASEDSDFGFFVFSKDILSEKNILTNNKKEGKRGFRIYPNWTVTESIQATKTQKWQTEYFINSTVDFEKFINIIKNKKHL